MNQIMTDETLVFNIFHPVNSGWFFGTQYRVVFSHWFCKTQGIMGEKKRLAICCGVSAPTSNLFIALSMEKTRSWFQLFTCIYTCLHVLPIFGYDQD